MTIFMCSQQAVLNASAVNIIDYSKIRTQETCVTQVAQGAVCYTLL